MQSNPSPAIPRYGKARLFLVWFRPRVPLLPGVERMQPPSSSFGFATEHTPIKGPADRFAPRQRCNDPVPAVLMVVHLVAVVAIACADIPTAEVDTSDKSMLHMSGRGVIVTVVPALLTGAASIALAPVSYTHLTLPTTPYV